MSKQTLVALVLVVSFFQAGQCAVAQERGRQILHEQPKEFTCTDDGTYPAPGECTGVYYLCSGGIAYTQVCPEGGVFDPITFVCTPSDEASCNQKFNCPTDGLFPYPDACANFYYICSSGQSYIGYCPPNFVFDPLTFRCETKETASCTPTDAPTDAPTDTPTDAPTDAPTETTEVPTETTEVPTETTETPTDVPTTNQL